MILQCRPLITDDDRDAVNAYMHSGGFLTEYKETELFEKELAAFLDAPYVSLVPSGTVSLYVALKAAGVNYGDEVLVPNYTMIATANAVNMAGANVKLIDINPYTLLMDLDSIEINPHTKAVIFVDINGRGSEIDVLKRLCDKYGITLIEDACQALGSQYKSKKLGTYGRFGCFSLSFHKLITTGEGGFVVSQTKDDYEMVERLKNYGRLEGGADYHEYMGYNFLYTDLQAVIGRSQLRDIQKRIDKKREMYKWYFGGYPEKDLVPWFYEYRTDDVAGFVTFMRNHDIQVRPFYPPISSQPIYRSPYAFREITGAWLPSSLTLSKRDIKHIKAVIKEYENQ